jgi:hypothetical protein
MQPSPSPDEAKTAYEERLETLTNPEPPSPTQEEADAMKTGTYQQDVAPEGETAEAKEAREKRQRDMKPAAPRAEYTTR